MIATLARYEIGTQANSLYRFVDVADKKVIDEFRTGLRKRAKGNPERRMLIVYSVSGHGFQIDG